MKAKLFNWAEEKGSRKTRTATRNCSVGDRYWRMPNVESRSRRAATPKNNSGTVVIGPLSIKRPKSQPDGSCLLAAAR